MRDKKCISDMPALCYMPEYVSRCLLAVTRRKISRRKEVVVEEVSQSREGGLKLFTQHSFSEQD